jgi:uncharacterized protein involved in exopolysaccharide biosynthesis
VKIAAVILCGLGLTLTASAQEVRLSPCEIIAQFDTRISRYRKPLAELLLRYTDAHPDVVSLKEIVARAEGDRAAAVAQAASEGVVCSRSELRRENALPQAESQTPSPNVR